MDFDALTYKYPSRRHVIYAKKGIVAASQPLAAQAGLEMLKKGGNAIDAAIATATCLTVVEPTSNGVGGDAFALIWTGGKLYGLNASGPAPREISAEIIKNKGYDSIPKYGWIPVTVPGAPSAWAELSKRFGRLPLSEVMKPAIEYAAEGYPVSPVISKLWNKAFITFRSRFKGEEFKHWFSTFTPKGTPPKAGEIWRSEALARTLQSIADTYADSFYHGDLCDKIDTFSRQHGGYLRKWDLENYKPEWVEPVSINYKGYDIWEIPPNGHGIVALMALNILSGFDFRDNEDIETVHRQIEAMKLAYVDGQKYIADPRKMSVKTSALLSKDYAAERRNLIGSKALIPEAGQPPKGGTVYLAAADGEGNMISYIQSNYMGFGSGLVVPDTGISLHNRGCNFTLDQDHDNCIEPLKKPYHTIIPGFLTKGGKPVGPFGVMGGFMQPQGHVQVIMNTVDFHMNPQAALDAPRWRWVEDKKVYIEKGFSKKVVDALIDKGHDIEVVSDESSFGRGQIIWVNQEGTLCGGTEPRADGAIASW
ncbi:MAG TPA: gamma-glutamyltransferase family protein [Clostridiaceae bacterium]|nr:gamma-glutamyltransferase family protein [Clostridiaceae bacterium]